MTAFESAGILGVMEYLGQVSFVWSPRTGGALRTVAILALLTGGCAVARANDIYIAQSSAGSGNGTSCVNAYAVTYFNTPANWTSATPAGTKIGPGSTVHLCGIFTGMGGSSGSTMLTAQGSGNSSSQITIHFETSAVLTAPFWLYPNGAINLNGYSYITIDGGTNGQITNTANGTGLTYKNWTNAIQLGNGRNNIVQNMTVPNMYQRQCCLCDGNGTNNCLSGSNVTAILGSGNNAIIQNNLIYNVGWAIICCGANTTIRNNEIYWIDHATATGASVWYWYGNHVHDWNVWDDTGSEWCGAGLATGTIVAIGSGYVNGDVVTVSQSGASGGQFTLTVSGGIVTGLTLLHHGTGYTAPGGTAVGLATTGGTGSGLTISIQNQGCNNFHHDGVHCYINETNAAYVYNNQFDGNTGNTFNQPIFLEGGNNSDATRCFALGWIKSATIGSGGSGYVVGDVASITQSGALYGEAQVTSVNGSGAVTGFNIVENGNHYTVANGLSTTGGTGTGFTINVTGIQNGGTSYIFNNVSLLAENVNFGGPPEGSTTDLNVNNGDIYANNLNKGDYNGTPTPSGLTNQYIPSVECTTCGVSYYNNALSSLGNGITAGVSPNNTIDYDAYEHCASIAGCFIAGQCNGCSWLSPANATANGHTGQADFQTKTAATGQEYEAHGIASSTLATGSDNDFFKLNSACVVGSVGANCMPTASSPLRGAGKNLYSICNGRPNPGLGALCFDAAGVARPATGGWDIGPYQFSSSANPSAATNLTVTVQ